MPAPPRKLAERFLAAVEERQRFVAQTSPSTKIAQRGLHLEYRTLVVAGRALPSIRDAGFRVFSQFDEDGIILLLLAATGVSSRRFIDLGAGNGTYASNCANLAFNLGYDGLFVEADPAFVERGERIYGRHQDTRYRPPVFRRAVVGRDNVNDLLEDAGYTGAVDVLSIDIDGNDYWVWQAIERVTPAIVVIETHPSLGTGDVVTPYDERELVPAFPGAPPIGASPTAMTRLARELGYRLVGWNRFGFNLFYVREDMAADALPTLEVRNLLASADAEGPA